MNLPFANAQVLDKKLFVTPPLYQVNKTSDTLVIDGRADEEAWLSAPFIDSFGDIVDHSRDAGLKTRVKMLWDERFVYVYAELKEKDIWATFRQFDSSIFHENAFELFIDADGDGQQYVELQINALGTIWDLFMTKPYRDRGVNVRDWDIKGLKQAVSLSGTLNDPSDRDTCWSIELAIPVSAVVFNQKYVLVEGSMWRMNFSRVQWDIGVVEQEYKKNRDSLGNVIDAKYSVWSPQGVVNLHMPERWGYVVFADKKVGGNEGLHFQERYKQVESRLWKIYYLQKKYKEINGCFASSIEELRYLFPKDVLVREGPVSLKANCFQFWVQYVNDLGKIEMAVDQDGKVYHNLPMEVNSK
ncbi:carbohydrate-binding family 9-like protein [Olivibacter sitiensis]|uniref:carbohydrate-binding family 9-like protein n=1 Tax=Olivibacter sitiensis TaxID=376470 RepID=UPI00055D8080|nr:carbohydrate-binding family 9-like protein [Olivibacter sitiensis]